METVLKSRSEVILLGDLNCDIGKHINHTPGQTLLEFMNNFALTNLINQPTRPNSGTLLDVILVTHARNFTSNRIVATGASDHHICCASYTTKILRNQPKLIKFRKTNKTNFQSLNNDLREIHWEGIYRNVRQELLQADVVWENWITTVNAVLEKHSPLKTKLIKAQRPPWITTEIDEAIRIRDQMSKLPKIQENITRFRIQRNLVTKLKRQSLKEYLQKASKTSPSRFHRNLQRITGIGKAKASQVSNLIDNNCLITSPKSKAEIINNYFSTCVPPPRVWTENDLEHHPSIRPIVNFFCKSFSSNYTTDDEVYSIINNINNNKATGADNISARFLKEIITSITPPLTDLFNHFITINEIPKQWKHGLVSPIHKKNDPTNKENYRPITILTHISKVFERILTNQLNSHFRPLFPSDMFGFIQGHNSEMALLKLTQDCRSSIDDRKSTIVVSLDLSKAFDMVEHPLLMKKLKSYGVDLPSCRLLNSYLSGRTQSVKIQNELSNPSPYPRGVPQGAILAPLLFNIYVADFSFLSLNSSIIRYADDTTLYLSSKNKSTAIDLINQDLEKVHEWFKVNGLQLNPSKTQCIIITNNPEQTNKQITIHTTQLPWLNKIKILGAYIDCKLSMKEHLKHCIRKANLCLYQIKQVKRSLNPELTTALYSTYIRPHLENCSLLLLGIHQTDNHKLENIQQKSIKQLTSCSNYHRKVQLESLLTRRIIKLSTTIHYALSTGTPKLISTLFKVSNTKYTSSKRPKKLISPRCHTTYLRWSFVAVGTRLWQYLPETILSQTSHSFKAVVTKYLTTLDWVQKYQLMTLSSR